MDSGIWHANTGHYISESSQTKQPAKIEQPVQMQDSTSTAASHSKAASQNLDAVRYYAAASKVESKATPPTTSNEM